MVEKEPYGEVFLINKPYGWTSFDAVRKIRNALGIKKVGHAGTLDPLATGLLIICAGKMTKQIDSFQAQEKEYTGTFVLGKTTESFDLEREVIDVADPSNLRVEAIKEAAAKLTGEILQVPPAHSAIKKDGKRVYESARKGIEVVLESRPVTVSLFEITRCELPEIDFRVICSKGTYIRSLARDLGNLLKVGAYMSALTRTRIGDFRLEDATDVEEMAEKIKARKNENL
jgi:tRNA pseudouridine55 synthase